MRADDHATLSRVHPVLAATVYLAVARFRVLHPEQVRVTSGLRTPEEQRRLVAAGVSRNPASAHLDGLAVDLAILNADRSRALWDFPRYEVLNGFMQKAFRELTFRHGDYDGKPVLLLWGGVWTHLRDGVHWELQGLEQTPNSHF